MQPWLLVMTGCTMGSKTPSDKVKDYLNRYKNNETIVVNELNEYFLFLVKYFIKPEYQQKILEEGYLAITSHQ